MNRTFLALLILTFCIIELPAQTAIATDGVTITNAKYINSPELDFSPAIYQDGVVFVSSRNDDRKTDRSISESFFDLFFADLSNDGIPGPPQQFSAKINTKYHEGPVSFNKAGDKIYFTRNNLDEDNDPIKGDEGVVRMKIYEASKGITEWENIQELPFNSDDYSCMHPAVDAKNKRIYFASDMPGGYGGMDIYYSEWENGDWSAPVNIGAKANSEANDVFPFMHPSGVLYFSSDQAGGLGGFDLYRLMPDEEIPFALRLSEPYNSTADDIGLIVSDKGTSGFFTSARGGGMGEDDIFAFTAPNGVEGIEKPKQYLKTNFMFYDALTMNPLPNVGVQLFSADQKEELLSLYDVQVKKANDETIVLGLSLTEEGENAIPDFFSNKDGRARTSVAENQQYIILAKKKGYEAQEFAFNTFTDDNELTFEILLSPEMKIGDPVVIEKGSTIIMDKIFYDFDKSYIRSGAARDLDALVVLMNKNSSVEIDLIAHTDSRGSSDYNMELSENRAISAKNYLVAKGIQSGRIRTYGKGESTPRNGCVDGVTCTELEHQYNRRTEIFIREMEALDKVVIKQNTPDVIDTKK